MKIHETITPDMVMQQYKYNKNYPITIISILPISLILDAQILRNEQTIAHAPVVVFDGNISTDTMGTILELCRKYEKPGECVLYSKKIFIHIFY